jgi:hypothetical protein
MQSLIKSLLVIAIGVSFASCKERKQDKSYTNYRKYRQYIIEEEYDSSGKLYLSKSYTPNENGEGLTPNGAEIHYYPNGNIKKWAWFNATLPSAWDGTIYKHGYMYFYYDTSGKYDTARGNFCIQITGSDKITNIEMVKPPNIKCAIAFTEKKDGRTIRHEEYKPIVTDSTYWIKIENLVLNDKNEYRVYYYILDDRGNRIDSFSQDFGK